MILVNVTWDINHEPSNGIEPVESYDVGTINSEAFMWPSSKDNVPQQNRCKNLRVSGGQWLYISHNYAYGCNVAYECI